jgi:hypothetical protein
MVMIEYFTAKVAKFAKVLSFLFFSETEKNKNEPALRGLFRFTSHGIGGIKPAVFYRN